MLRQFTHLACVWEGLLLAAHTPVVLSFQSCFWKFLSLEYLACGLQYSKERIPAPRLAKGERVLRK